MLIRSLFVIAAKSGGGEEKELLNRREDMVKSAGHAGYIITCCHFDLGGNKYDCCQEPLFKTSNVACAQAN